MNPGPVRLSAAQAGWLVFYLTLGLTPFTAAELVDGAMGRWAWASIVPGWTAGLLGLLAVAVLRRRRPQSSALEYAPALFGRQVGWLYLLVLGLVLAAGAVLTLHTLLVVLGLTLAAETPQWLLALILTALAGYAAFFGPEVIARVGEIMLILVLPGLAFTLGVPWINAEPGRLVPMAAVPWSVLLGNWRLTAALGFCHGFLPLLVLAPAVTGPGAVRNSIVAHALAGILLLVALALPVAVLGLALAARLHFPLLEAVGTLAWRSVPFQRLGQLAVLVWQIVALIALSTYLWLAAAVGGWLFAGGRWRPLVPALGTAVVAVISLGLRGGTWLAGIAIWHGLVVAVGVLGPLSMALAALVRRPRLSA